MYYDPVCKNTLTEEQVKKLIHLMEKHMSFAAIIAARNLVILQKPILVRTGGSDFSTGWQNPMLKSLKGKILPATDSLSTIFYRNLSVNI